MKLSKREKNMAIAVGIGGALALILLAWQYLFAGGESVPQLQTRLDTLSDQVDAKKRSLDKAKRVAANLDDWKRRSLPSNVEIGDKLYKIWLQGIVDDAKFHGQKIEVLPGQASRGVYKELKYSVHGQANMQQLTKFLFDFYKAGHLHKISNLQMVPVKDSNELTLDITIAALSLTDATRRDKLTDVSGNRLQKKSVEEYTKAIADRNVFAAYTPPKPPPATNNAGEVKPPEPPKFNHLEFTKLTGITAGDGQPVAWIETKTTGKSYKVREGEDIDVDSAKIKILHIGVRDVEMQIGDEKRTISLGQNLLGK